MAIRIITDSAADFDREVAKRRKIDIVSLSVQFGSASFQKVSQAMMAQGL